MFGALGGARAATGVSFMSQAAVQAGVKEKLGLQKAVAAVSGTRTIRKKDMIHNSYTPQIEVDSQTYEERSGRRRGASWRLSRRVNAKARGEPVEA